MNPGDSLDGRYTIIDRLGAGGMGEVYKATHTMLGSTRVIKIVRPQIAGNTDAQDRFIREARASTKVHHPNVATLHDFATLPDGSHYMVWEYIDGENLAQRLRARGTLPPRQAIRIIVQALRGLDAIHRAGIVHRDISPENLMITHDDDSVKIIDLGVAKVEDTDVAQTRTGIFVGKLRYASPEQLGFLPEGERIDARADLYSLAMVLVELLTGRPPYEAKSPHEYFILHARDVQTMTVELPVGLPGGAALQKVLDKALARDRNQRFANAREFASALEEIERSLPEQRDLPTVATPLDGDETMRVRPANETSADTLHRDTVRTNAGPTSASAVPLAGATLPGEVTVKTPLPMPVSAPPPPPPPPPPAPQAAAPMNAAIPTPVKRRSSAPAIIIILIALLLVAGAVAGGIYYAWPKISQFVSKKAEVATTTGLPETSTVATNTASATTASSSVDVTEPVVNETPTLSTTNTPTATFAPAQTQTIAPTPRPRPVQTDTLAEAAPQPDETAADDDEPAEEGSSKIDRTWRPGRGRRSVGNWRAELAGTRTISLRAGNAQLEMTRALRRAFPGIRFEPYADVVVKYDRRSNSGSVSKDGRILYASEASSPDAFARELAEIFNGE